MSTPPLTQGPKQQAINIIPLKQPASTSSNPWNIKKTAATETKESTLFQSGGNIAKPQPVWGNTPPTSSSISKPLNTKEYPSLGSAATAAPTKGKQIKKIKGAPQNEIPKEVKPFSWNVPRTYEKGSSAAAATPQNSTQPDEKAQSDLNLSSEIVGDSSFYPLSTGKSNAISLKQLTADDSQTESFFAVVKKKKNSTVSNIPSQARAPQALCHGSREK